MLRYPSSSFQVLIQAANTLNRQQIPQVGQDNGKVAPIIVVSSQRKNVDFG